MVDFNLVILNLLPAPPPLLAMDCERRRFQSDGWDAA